MHTVALLSLKQHNAFSLQTLITLCSVFVIVLHIIAHEHALTLYMAALYWCTSLFYCTIKPLSVECYDSIMSMTLNLNLNVHLYITHFYSILLFPTYIFFIHNTIGEANLITVVQYWYTDRKGSILFLSQTSIYCT